MARKRKKKDLWWYINQEYGLPALKRKFTRKTGIPTTKAAAERKIGRLLISWLTAPFKKTKDDEEEEA